MITPAHEKLDTMDNKLDQIRANILYYANRLVEIQAHEGAGSRYLRLRSLMISLERSYSIISKTPNAPLSKNVGFSAKSILKKLDKKRRSF